MWMIFVIAIGIALAIALLLIGVMKLAEHDEKKHKEFVASTVRKVYGRNDKPVGPRPDPPVAPSISLEMLARRQSLWSWGTTTPICRRCRASSRGGNFCHACGQRFVSPLGEFAGRLESKR